MTGFHIGKKGLSAQCRAKPGNCPLKNSDGTSSPHFETREKMDNFIDYSNQMIHEGTFPSKINVNDLIGLCQGAWAIYKSLINYTKICANFQMRYLLIELYTKILTIGISGSSIFASGANAKYLKYICARFMLNHHFGIDKNVHESAMNQAKIENDTEKAFINQLVLETPKDHIMNEGKSETKPSYATASSHAGEENIATTHPIQIEEKVESHF